jgi:alpha-1,3-glucan synthase
MWYMRLIVAHATLAGICFGLQYRKDLVDWNLNTAEFATSVLDYDSSRSNTTYSPSPPNWRALPFYTVLLDKFADGDPTNNDFFGSVFEHDWRETGLRFGGDVLGLQHRLDYLQGMGIRGIFIAGTPFVNMPWQADAYSPIDFSTLDPHWGRIDDWHTLIDEIHARGMYIMLDFTVGTLGDFIGFEGHKNKSTPFNINEYNTVWKRPSYAPWGIDKYSDFKVVIPCTTIPDRC